MNFKQPTLRFTFGISLACLLGSLVVASCERRPDSERTLDFDIQPAESATDTAPEQPSIDRVIPQAPEREPELRSSPFRVGALLDRGDGNVLAGLVEPGADTYNLVRVGDSFRGFEVKEIDADAERVYLERDGARYVARVEPQVPAPVPVDNELPRVLDAETFAEGPRERFEPTADELARGIDPNDPATWPERGYRGPGIERSGMEPMQFDALDFEKEKGIDPNDPDTWPPGYRGPGIERAMRGLLGQEE